METTLEQPKQVNVLGVDRVVHVARSTYPASADTRCGLKQLRVTVFTTDESHPDLGLRPVRCPECFTLDLWEMR